MGNVGEVECTLKTNRIPSTSTTTSAQKQDDPLPLEGSNIQDMIMRMNEMKKIQEIVRQFFRDVMNKDIDYRIIPGTQKPALHKPGAEKLCELFNFAITIAEIEEEKDLYTGYYRARLVIRLVHRGTGTVVAEGVGAATVYESKYRWRWVFEKDIPRGVDKESLISKVFTNDDGTSYRKYRIENPELFDFWNTALKIAKKRALVDATITATRSSGIFTQDDDELDAWIGGRADDPTEPKPQRQQKQQRQNTRTQQKKTSSQSKGNASADPNAPASVAQIKAIFGTGKNKGLKKEEVKDLVFYHTGKKIDIGEQFDNCGLTYSEASDLIKFMQKASKDDLITDIAARREADA